MLRYIVERISDGKFLELELPITVSGAGPKLNGAGTFSGTLEPDVGGLRDASGALLIDPYATFISEEADGVIRGTWIVTRSEIEGDRWTVEGAGVSSFFRDRPYEGDYWGVQVDPVAVARHVAVHAQSFAGADIGVKVVGSSSVKVGTTSDDEQIAAQKAADAAKTDVAVKNAALADARAKAKADPSPANKNLVVVRQAAAKTAAEQKKKRDAALKAAKAQTRADDGAWKLHWWDTPDCLNAMEEAIAAADMEWVEWSGWNADRTKILKEIRVAPRVGRRRDDAVFVEGDNITETVVVEDDVAEYANKVVAIGAGEGRDALRVTKAVADGRRSRVYVLEAKEVTKRAVLERMASEELTKRTRRLRIAAVRVDASHPNAARGTFGVGDTILIDAEVGWIGRRRLWHRITEIEWVGLDVADLMLEAA